MHLRRKLEDWCLILCQMKQWVRDDCKKICNLQKVPALEWERCSKMFQSWWKTDWLRIASRSICLGDRFNCKGSEDCEKATKLREIAWLILFMSFKGEAGDPLWTMLFLNIQNWFKRVIILIMASRCWSFKRERIEEMNHSLKELKLLHSGLMERDPHQTARASGHKKKMLSHIVN